MLHQSMKTEVRNAAELAAWLSLSGPAVIQGLDLTAASAQIATSAEA